MMTYFIFSLFLKSKIVPNDTKKHVISAIKGILDTLGHDITIKVIYTDDYMKNHLVLMKLFKK